MKKQLSPYFIIILSFFIIIVLGTIILSLPIAHKTNMDVSFTDALFTTTSAITVTGFSPFTDITSVFNTFGLVVIILLVKIGGLSVITVTYFVLFLMGAKINITNRFILKESLNQESLSKVVKNVIKIVIFSIVIEIIGFIINMIAFINIYELKQAIIYSAFHAVSAFNNAGFTLLGVEQIAVFNQSPLLMINTMALIMIGGIGFIVIFDLLSARKNKKITNHTRIVLKTNVLLWVLGTLLFYIGQLKNNPISIMDALFLSVNARSAGFYSVYMESISQLSLLVLLVLMVIGASPGSTGGGIKTTTAYTIAKSILGYAKGSFAISKNRKISQESKSKAFVLFTSVITLILFGSFLLLLIEDIPLVSALFEIVGAISNSGLSLNMTQQLLNSSKVLLVGLMFIGRVGPLVILGLFNFNWNQTDSANIDYLEEKIMIG